MISQRRVQMILFVFVSLVLSSCHKSVEPTEAGLEGQVYTNKGPAGHVVFQSVATIQVRNATTFTVISEVSSAADGTFKISLSPGSYILTVKGSSPETQTGPYQVVSGKFLQAEAFYASMSL